MPIIVNPQKFNPNTLVLDNAYLIVEPPPSYAQGAPSDVFGVVGTAAWGPVNQPVLLGGAQSIAPNFGLLVGASVTDPHDLVRDLIIAFEQATGGGGMQGWAVRVSDGNDHAASVTLQDTATTPVTAGTQSALWTGSLGNQLQVTLQAGSGTGITAILSGFPGTNPESFPNLPAGAAFWPAYSSALAQGLSGVRGPSALMRFAVDYTQVTDESQTVSPTPNGTTLGPFTATLAHAQVKPGSMTLTQGSVTLTDNGRGGLSGTGGTGTIDYATGAWSATYTTAPANTATWTAVYSYQTSLAGPKLGAYTLAAGTDGRSTVTSAQLLGQNTTYPFTGAYALSGLSPAPGVAWIAGLTDSTVFTNFQEVCDNGAMAGLVALPIGTSTADAVTQTQAIGFNDFEMGVLKDWVYFDDTVNNQIYLTSPLPVMGGLMAVLGPQFSPGNQQVYGIVGTERNNPFTGNIPYSDGELATLEANGIVVITKPIPGGNVLGMRNGQNQSSNPAENNFAYTKMTNWLARSMYGLMGKYVDQPQTIGPGDPLRAAIRTEVNGLMKGLKTPQGGGAPAISAWNFKCDHVLNTQTTIAQGFLFFQLEVTYLAITRFVVGYLRGGATVVTVSQAPLSQQTFLQAA